MTAKNTLATALVVFATGIAVGVLIAPASGKETRKKIRRKTVGAKDTLGYGVLRVKDLLSKKHASEAAGSTEQEG